MTKLAWWIVGLLGIEFVLGMLANMYEEIPAEAPYSVLRHPGFIAFHAANGILLTLLVIVFVWLAWKQRHQLNLAIAGLVSVFVAHAAGVGFLHTQQDWYSLLMAIGFLGAFFSYSAAAVTAEKK